MNAQLFQTAYWNTSAAHASLEREQVTHRDVIKTRDYLRAALAAVEALESAMRTGQEPKEGE